LRRARLSTGRAASTDPARLLPLAAGAGTLAYVDAALERATRRLARQHGMAHVAQLRRDGVSDERVRARLASGSWRPVLPEVVGAAGVPETPLGAVWRAVLGAGVRADGTDRPLAVGSLAAGAVLGRLDDVPEVVEVVVPLGAWCPRPPGVRVRRVKDWADRRFVRVGGLLVTALADTLVDVAPYFGDDDLLTLLQRECYDRVDLLGRVLARCHRGSKGSARARRVAVRLALGADSALHARAVAVLRAAGLTPTACGVEVVPGAGPTDCVYVAGGRPVLAVEVDGDVHRLSRKAFLHDRAKDLALREAGCLTLRFTVEQVSRPERMVADVRRALSTAAPELCRSARGAGAA
jgi:hypothetical protein